MLAARTRSFCRSAVLPSLTTVRLGTLRAIDPGVRISAMVNAQIAPS